MLGIVFNAGGLLKRLLFVDDEEGIRATLPVILRRYGFQVAAAATIAEALQEMKQNIFDLLLCDLNIEGEGDGYGVVKAMREANPGCVIVILTGNPHVENAKEGNREPADGIVLKPIDAATLATILSEKLLTRSRASNAV